MTGVQTLLFRSILFIFCFSNFFYLFFYFILFYTLYSSCSSDLVFFYFIHFFVFLFYLFLLIDCFFILYIARDEYARVLAIFGREALYSDTAQVQSYSIALYLSYIQSQHSTTPPLINVFSVSV